MNLVSRLSASAALCALAATAAQAQQTATFGGSDAVGSPVDRQNRMFVELVEEMSESQLVINFIEGEQLGNDTQVIEQVMGNSVQFYGDDLSWYANWVKDFSILGWGFTFHGTEHLDRFFESDIYAEMKQELIDEHGVRILAEAGLQPRMTFVNRPIESVDDLEGIKMRVPGIRTYVDLWETLGASPTNVAWGEVFLALRTGVVEAAEGPISSAYAARFHEAAPYVIRTDHIFTATHILVNEDYYQSLSPELQQIVQTAAEEATDWAASEASAETDNIISKMQEEGATVLSIDLAPVRQRAVSAVEEVEADGVWSEGLWQSVQDLAE